MFDSFKNRSEETNGTSGRTAVAERERGDEVGATRYLFGALDQRTFGMSIRASQTFSPTLSLQLYAQPFIAAGTFSDFRRVESPRADRFDERFSPVAATRTADGGYTGAGMAWDNPDFDSRALNVNAVLRWE